MEYLPTVIATVAAAFVGWLVSRWQTRKDYQYKRSKAVTESRFQKEFEAVTQLSRYLYLLVNALVEHESLQTSIDLEQWKSWEDKVKELLGENAPIIRYIDLSGTGCEYCGVNVSKLSNGGRSYSPEDLGFFSTIGMVLASFWNTTTKLDRLAKDRGVCQCGESLFLRALIPKPKKLFQASLGFECPRFED